MNFETYDLTYDEQRTVFEFTSSGPKGNIKKLVTFSPTSRKGVYNLAMGDIDSDTGKLDDKVVTNNGDMERVLATVVQCIQAFCILHPGTYIAFNGSSKSRNRLYRIAISKNIVDMEKEYKIYGKAGNEWEVFNLNIAYDSFLIIKKTI
jgi:hypothetical protein